MYVLCFFFFVFDFVSFAQIFWDSFTVMSKKIMIVTF